MKKTILIVMLTICYQSCAMLPPDCKQIKIVPVYCLQQGIKIPEGFWRFWAEYYENPQNQNALRATAKYAAFNTLIWQVYEVAEAEQMRQSGNSVKN